MGPTQYPHIVLVRKHIYKQIWSRITKRNQKKLQAEWESKQPKSEELEAPTLAARAEEPCRLVSITPESTQASPIAVSTRPGEPRDVLADLQVTCVVACKYIYCTCDSSRLSTDDLQCIYTPGSVSVRGFPSASLLDHDSISFQGPRARARTYYSRFERLESTKYLELRKGVYDKIRGHMM
jgi:hypothetical protein